MHKISCGSAIKVNFIALALHYICRKNKLKPFGKMRTFILILGIIFTMFGIFDYGIVFLAVAIYMFINKGSGGTGGKYKGDEYFIG